MSNYLFATYYPHYIEKLGTIESTYNPSLFCSLFKLILLLGVLSNCIVKFAIHHPHYKDIIDNPTQTFACATNCLSFLYSWSNLLTAILAHNGNTCAAKAGLVTKKGEPPRISLHLFSYQPPSLFLSLMFSKMRPAIFKYSLISEYLAMSKYVTISKWQLNSILASFFLLADYPLVKLTSKN